MVVRAEALLQKIQKEEEEKLLSIQVPKTIDVAIDAGNLLACDSNPIDTKQLRSDKENYLKNLAREGTQLLFNEIWKLPIERVQDAVIAKVPAPTTVIPREKPIPKAKPPTKWEEYAKLKGIRKLKKGRMVWDDESKSWKPRWGYKRANDDTKEWVLEVPANADPNEDQFEKKLKEKKERVAKNELQRLRNVARRTGKKVPGVGRTAVGQEKQSKLELEAAFHVSKQATASLGRFQETLKGEKNVKKRGQKRKFEAVTQKCNTEKEKQLSILNQMYKKSPQLNLTKAVNKEIQDGQVKNPKAGKRKNTKPAKSKAGGKRPTRGKR
uniref:Ribosome biogenesis regulatory protein n=1 Tax=Ciona intestinalis TaxID=7719 RepID=F6SS76_CIOIN|nr:ribosome biogenesis regulatory protein homolog [Ciona intestinalis]|eukprot:XP_002125582.1 ribosome biogenesis regulatory protein homolog [Ciona intestinalis]